MSEMFAVVAIASISIRYVLTDKGRMISLHPITDPAVAMRNSPMLRAVYLTLDFAKANGPIGPTAKVADHSRFRAKRN